MLHDLFNPYNIVWIFVAFDLPTNTRKERKAAAEFRKQLVKDGFDMFQYSIYIRHCMSHENADKHTRRVKKWLPEYGKVSVLRFTDKQFGNMEVFHGRDPAAAPEKGDQLIMF